MEFYTPITLKLHAFGLQRLHDPNWSGTTLFDELKRPVRRTCFLQKFEKEGFLVWLGNHLFEEYMLGDEYVENLRGEYLLWHLEDYTVFLSHHGAERWFKSRKRLDALVARVAALFDSDEEKYWQRLRSARVRERFCELYRTVRDKNEEVIRSVGKRYAANYADRVFHDRELCGFVSQLLVRIGFDGTDSPTDTEPRQWVDRVRIPAWAKKAVIARDNGMCGQCRANITMRLEADDHFDHMVPISRGGCNDIVNLQLLCECCNLSKANKAMSIVSSIPPYTLRFHKKKR